MEDSVDYNESLISQSLNNTLKESVQENDGAEKQQHLAEQTGKESSSQDEDRHDDESEAKQDAKPKGFPYLTLPDEVPGTEEAAILFTIIRD